MLIFLDMFQDLIKIFWFRRVFLGFRYKQISIDLLLLIVFLIEVIPLLFGILMCIFYFLWLSFINQIRLTLNWGLFINLRLFLWIMRFLLEFRNQEGISRSINIRIRLVIFLWFFIDLIFLYKSQFRFDAKTPGLLGHINWLTIPNRHSWTKFLIFLIRVIK